MTGANGQLGNELRVLSKKHAQHTWLFTDVEELDITDESAVNGFFAGKKIDVCINAAAYTAVDKAESEPELAYAINAKGVRAIGEGR